MKSACLIGILMELLLASPVWARVQVHFQGTHALSPGRLRSAAADELALLERPGQLAANADDAAFAMQTAYREAGYAFAQVHAIIEGPGNDSKVVFRVEEGLRVVLSRLEFEGGTLLPQDRLRAFYQAAKVSFMGSRRVYVESHLASALGAIKMYYLNQGYLDFKTDPPDVRFSPDRRSVRIRVVLREGKDYRIQQVLFTGDLLPEAHTALGDAEKEFRGQPYYKRQESLLRSRILERYGDLGYPNARVEVSACEQDQAGHMRLNAEIASGNQVRVGMILIQGNLVTDPQFIAGRVTLHTGEVYSLAKQRESFTALYRTGLFSKISLELSPTGTEGVENLLVEVTETDFHEAYFEPGWGSYEFLRLQAGITEKNLFRSGRSALLQSGVSFKGYEAAGTLTDPWFLGSTIVAELYTYIRQRTEPTYTNREIGNSLTNTLRLTSSLLVSAAYTYRYDQLFDVAPDADLRDQVSNYRVASLTLRIGADTRNNLIYPSFGQQSYATAEFSDPRIGSQIPYSRFTAGFHWYVPLGQDSILAYRYDTGFIIPGVGQILVPVAERFYNGGENTVRSFNQDQIGPVDPAGNPIGGLGYNVTSLEFRQRIYANILGSVFADFGNVTPNRSRTAEGISIYDSRTTIIQALFRDYFRDFRTSVGVGLEYLLPVGPARLDFAFNPAPRSDRGEHHLVIQFSIGTAF